MESLEIKNYLTVFFNNNDMLPPMHCIASRFNVHESKAKDWLLALEKEGFIKRNVCNKYMFTRGQ